jgi:hypothetical protein
MSQVLRFRDNNYDVPRSVAFLPFILYVQIVMDVYPAIWFAAWRLRIIFCNDVFGLCRAINKFGGIDKSRRNMSQVLRFRDNNYDVPRSVAFLPFILYVQIVMDSALRLALWQ